MIKIRYLAHSSFLIQCGDLKLIFDPWLKGPAYSRQWFLWPPSEIEVKDLNPDVILISHGHEDHLHIESLIELKKNAKLFFPFQWRDGVKPFLKQLGFEDVVEAVSFKSYKIKGVTITYIGFSLESVIVLEYEGEVLVNINDALNSNHETAVEFILEEINKRWTKIDYLFSGWSGASYFPNQVRYQGKDDIETGKLREQYFANNFCRFVNSLNPKFAVPFVPGFVLLKNENRWINHIKFPRKNVKQYYEKLFEKPTEIEFIISYPGDLIENGNVENRSVYHKLPEEEHYLMAYDYYKNDLEESNKTMILSDDLINILIKDLSHWINFNKQIYHVRVLMDSVFSIKLEDANSDKFINVYFNEDKFIVERSDKPLEHRRLMINTSGEKLIYALKKEWGGDILTIGYGLTVEIENEDSLEKNLDIVCVRLITRYPIASKDFFKFPARALKYYGNNPRLTTLWLKQKFKLKPYVNKYPFNERDHWLTYNKCDLCAVCRMPEIDPELFLPSNKADTHNSGTNILN